MLGFCYGTYLITETDATAGYKCSNQMSEIEDNIDKSFTVLALSALSKRHHLASSSQICAR